MCLQAVTPRKIAGRLELVLLLFFVGSSSDSRKARSAKAITATPTIYSRVHGKVVTHSGVATNTSSAPRSG